MAEAVVDDLEPVQIEVQNGEAIADPPAPALVEPPSEPLDEHRAIGESSQRIDETDGAEPLLRDRPLGRVGERSGNPIGVAAHPPYRHAAAEEPAGVPIFLAGREALL